MKKGHIFIDKEGVDVQRIAKDQRDPIFKDFFEMGNAAVQNQDKFYYVYSPEWEDFFSKPWSPQDPYWAGVSMSYITALQSDPFHLTALDNRVEFDALPVPQSHGGCGYEGHPMQDYLHNCSTWQQWHYDHCYHHPEDIDWKDTNGILPCRNRVVELLREELINLQAQAQAKEDESKQLNLTQPQYLCLQETCWTAASDEAVVTAHNDMVIRHQGEQIKAYSEKIGTCICEMNYYHREKELEDLERNHGNRKISRIFSILKDGHYQFLSIDTAHGKFELCDENGVHLGEYRWDGSPNGENTIEPDHGLRCVAEWRVRFRR